MRYLGYGLIFVLLMMSGCGTVRHVQFEEAEDINETEEGKRMMYTHHTEARYKLKPEPYSLDSAEKDPELLGPQTTLKRPSRPTTETSNLAVNVNNHTRNVAPQTHPTQSTTTNTASSMTRSECVKMVGESKFKLYSQKYGGESGAIRRCAILKRLRK